MAGAAPTHRLPDPHKLSRIDFRRRPTLARINDRRDAADTAVEIAVLAALERRLVRLAGPSHR